jgi:hypothetical protein
MLLVAMFHQGNVKFGLRETLPDLVLGRDIYHGWKQHKKNCSSYHSTSVGAGSSKSVFRYA